MKNGIVSRYWGLRPWTRHSMVLMVAGLVYVGIGLAYFSAIVSPERDLALQVVINLMPFKYWGLVFIAAGVAVILSSRWPPHEDKWGYQVLTGLSLGWASAYGLSMIFGDSPSSNITAFLVWSLISFMWWAIAGLLDPVTVVLEADKEV